ncbi:hypothetical protein CYFUS_006608 [Cystobacter fuscus]|uniref:Uncharacterized protein n=1 Tax=Cystobacter fuscus TaxID=43 RepID=A0A250JDB7_9BACT|nr:hypothetical protein CYFUS_006608 [Cystobacter fuscus]
MIDNHYAASIFRIDVILPDSEEDFRVINEERVASYTTKTFVEALRWRRDQRVAIHIAVMSLGEWKNFRTKDIDTRASGTLVITYGWDPATAEFGVGINWK